VINGLAVTVPPGLAEQLARFPGVESVRPDALSFAPASGTGVPATPEWNVDAVRAPALWSLGFSGSGVVVANMDNGVDAHHPELAQKWRGGGNRWFDPHGQHATPYDASGHGTQTMALMVGGDAGGSAIGMAPGARWIAVKLYDDAGQATFSKIHLAFQWLLDPDGNPDTVDSPDVVNASWGLVGTAGQCITEFDTDIQVLKAAGIAVAFAAGNDGPAPGTSLSAANNASSFAVGAVDAARAVASFSARGPSACTGATFPNIAAPGVDVRTADLSFGGLPFYVNVTGTSFAAPHAAGALALLMGAFPSASVSQLEGALAQGATDLGAAGADNDSGSGLLDINAAFQLLGGAGSPPSFTSVPVTTATEGVLYSYGAAATDPAGSTLTYSLDTAPAGMTIGASSGLAQWTPTAAQAGGNPVTVRATNARGLAATQSFTIQVALAPAPPVAVNDSATAPVRGNGNYTPVAIAVLANDTDRNNNIDPRTVTITTQPGKGGTATANANGTVSYTPKKNYRGTETFAYKVRDTAGALSNAATVTVTVQ
jgi:subtilisin family serine protease